MKIIIRKVKEKDFNTIQKMNNLLFLYEEEKLEDASLDMNWSFDLKGEEYFRDRIKNEMIFVAECEGKIVGYLSWCYFENYSRKQIKYAEIDNVFVLEEYRKEKVGSKLIDSFLEECKKNKIAHIIVSTNVKNEVAIKFYEKNGFTKKEVMLEWDGNK